MFVCNIWRKLAVLAYVHSHTFGERQVPGLLHGAKQLRRYHAPAALTRPVTVSAHSERRSTVVPRTDMDVA
jgi:hypothetical protein